MHRAVFLGTVMPCITNDTVHFSVSAIQYIFFMIISCPISLNDKSFNINATEHLAHIVKKNCASHTYVCFIYTYRPSSVVTLLELERSYDCARDLTITNTNGQTCIHKVIWHTTKEKQSTAQTTACTFRWCTVYSTFDIKFKPLVLHCSHAEMIGNMYETL